MKYLIINCGKLFINLLVIFEFLLVICGSIAIGGYVYTEFTGMLGVLAGIVSFIVLFIVLILSNYFFFMIINLVDNVQIIATSLEKLAISKENETHLK